MLAGGQVSSHVQRALIPDGRGQKTSPHDLRRQVGNLAPGTYINDILAEQDSALYRWPEHLTDALRVYIEPKSDVSGWSSAYADMARTVFAEWEEAGFPLRFTFIYDSTTADITIRWIDRFPSEDGQRIGETDRVQTSEFLITRARIRVANHDSLNRPLPPTIVGGVIRHEVGHALGLNHAKDRTSVMYYESATSAIAASDKTTLRVLYLVPPGSLK